VIGVPSGGDANALTTGMIDRTMASERPSQECAAAQQFLEFPNQDTFAAMFHLFTPQLVSFFRARGCKQALSEDLAQK
jgi:hypothetical protein